MNSATQWSSGEDDRLQGLSMLSQLIYLRVLRVKMDYSTGIAGGLRGKNIIRYSMIAERVGYVPDRGSNRAAWLPTRDEMRCSLSELERAGLIEDAGSNMQLGIIKKLVLALRGQSVQNMNPTGTPRKNPTGNPTGNPSGNAGYSDMSDTTSNIEKERGTPQHQVSVTTTTHAREPRFFSMHEEWQSDNESLSAHARMQGVLVDQLTADELAGAIGEFKSFWTGQAREETQSGWESKLVKSIKHKIARGDDGGSSRQGRGSGRGRKSGANNLISGLKKRVK